WDEAEGGRVDVAELCRVFGVSRQRGYVWLRRYREAGFDARALEDRSRRPHTSPTAISEPMQAMVGAQAPPAVGTAEAAGVAGPAGPAPRADHARAAAGERAPRALPSHARGCGHLAGTRERARAAACPGLVSSRVQRRAPTRGTRADPAGRALRDIESSLSV